MHPSESKGRFDVRDDSRELDDVLDARLRGGVDEVRLDLQQCGKPLGPGGAAHQGAHGDARCRQSTDQRSAGPSGGACHEDHCQLAAPSWRIIDAMSTRPQCSAIKPSSVKRQKSVLLIVNEFPVGGIPMNSPRWVPCTLLNAPTMSPSATIRSVVNRRSGKAPMSMRNSFLNPSRSWVNSGGNVGSWSGRSGVISSSAASTSCPFMTSS